jgi:hypothetical protein
MLLNGPFGSGWTIATLPKKGKRVAQADRHSTRETKDADLRISLPRVRFPLGSFLAQRGPEA